MKRSNAWLSLIFSTPVRLLRNSLIKPQEKDCSKVSRLFGNISTTVKKNIKKNKKLQTVTEAGLDYYLFDSKWYTEISNDESFLVSGHFRLQPYGDGTRKLIWINEYTKNGYHRKATIEKVKDGDIILT